MRFPVRTILCYSIGFVFGYILPMPYFFWFIGGLGIVTLGLYLYQWKLERDLERMRHRHDQEMAEFDRRWAAQTRPDVFHYPN